MAGEINQDIRAQRARKDVPLERKCLRCKTPFASEGFGERVCRRCKGSSTWRSASADSPGSTRRR